MAAVKCNYLVIYTNESQVFSSGSREIALESPPPEGVDIEDKRILFITYYADENRLVVKPLPLDEVRSAELKYPKPRPKKGDENDEP